MSFIAVHSPSGRPTVIPGSSIVSKSPENARSKSSSSPSGSSVARKPTSPKFTAKTGTPLLAYARSAVRMVPSPPITTQTSTSRESSAVELQPGARHQAVLAGLARRRSGASRRRARASISAPRAGAVSAARRWVSTVATRFTAHLQARRGVEIGDRARRGRARPARRTSPGSPPGPAAPRRRTRAPPRPRPRRRVATRDDRLTPQRGIADHAALADPVAADLELRLDHDERVEPLRGAREHRREHLGERDEGHVGDDEVGPVRQRRDVDGARVDALEHGHARVVAQRHGELAVRDVERDHMGGAALEQAVGEPAGRRADVERVAARRVEPEAVERVRQLDPAAGHVGRRRGHVEHHVLGHELARLLRAAAPGAEVHVARRSRLQRHGNGRGTGPAPPAGCRV